MKDNKFKKCIYEKEKYPRTHVMRIEKNVSKGIIS